MAGELHEISFLLGKLEAKINEMYLDMGQDRAIQSQDRSDMRVKINQFSDQMNKVDERLGEVEEFCKSNSPVLQQLNAVKSKVAFAVLIVGSLVTAVFYFLYTVIVNFGPYIKEVLTKMLVK